jgi:hypothetical protein
MADLHNPPEPEGPARREQGMRRVSTATRWTFAAAAAGSAALGLTYVNLAPGASGAPAPAPGTPTACTQRPTPPAGAVPSTTPPRGDREHEGDGEDDGERAVPAAAPAPGTAAPQTTVTCTPLTPPAQAPATTQQAPQTRTGAS